MGWHETLAGPGARKRQAAAATAAWILVPEDVHTTEDPTRTALQTALMIVRGLMQHCSAPIRSIPSERTAGHVVPKRRVFSKHVDAS